nr:reverse transcriptase domain-containing protein [Tanacetum cinerariifolium]
MLPVNQIDTFYNGLTLRHRDTINAAAGGTFMKRRPEECYDLIKNITAHHNNWDTSVQRSESSSSITSSSDLKIVALKAKTAKIKNLMKVLQINQQVKAVTPNCETCGGPHSYNNCPATVGQTQNVYAAGAYNQSGNSYQLQGSGTLPSNTITNSKEDLKGITTRSENAYKRPTIPTTFSPPKVVKLETNVTKDTVPPTNNGSTKDVQPRRSFLKTGRALIDFYKGELALRVGKEVVTFNLDQTSRYSTNYDAISINRIDLIDVACEEYSQEVLGFSVSGNPTPSMELIVSNSSPTLNIFEESGFLLQETDAFLAIDDEPISSEIDESYYDSEGDILLVEEFLNDDPSSPPLHLQELKVVESTNAKSSIDEPPVVELKDLPPHLEYAFLEGDDKLPFIITKDLKDKEKTALIKVLKSHKQALAWQLSDIKGIDPKFCTHKILMEDDFKLAIQHQRRVNPKIHEVIKKEVLKLLDAGLIYLSRQSFGDSHPQDQEKTTFTCPYRTFAYRRMPFGLCNAPSTFQRCLMAIFHDMIEKTMKVYMDDFSVFGNSFGTCLSYLDKMLKRCEDTNLCLNLEKSHFMVKEGIVLSHKISKNRIEVDKAKVDVIANLPHPTTVKGIRSFLGHVGFYRRFIQDFSKIARLMTRLLEKDTPFFFSKECVEAFQTLKKKLTEAPILVAPDWDLPFVLMCDASDFAIGAVLGHQKIKHFQPIHSASKTMTDAQAHYTTTEKELLAVVYDFEKLIW